MRKMLLSLCLLVVTTALAAQDTTSVTKDGQIILIADMQMQIDVNQSMNDLYNFKFDKAAVQFNYLRYKYPWHPLPYFLKGLSEWWKIMPDLSNEAYDVPFLAYMDTVILVAENMSKDPQRQVEASFFLAAAYGFQGRLYSSEERKNWRKAAVAGKNALKHMSDIRGKEELSVELLFGEGLYNYFSVWVSENYFLLKPVVALFPKGDKELGMKQLREVSYNAFYTRTEAMVFLMRILNSYENDQAGAFHISEYLYSTYPDNPYFHRYYARTLYSMGRFSRARPVSEKIIERIDQGMIGYEATSGRYAAFFLGQIYENQRDYVKAKYYYERAVEFATTIDADDSGYYHYSLLALGDIAVKDGDKKVARRYFNMVKDEAKRSDRVHALARERLKDL